MTQLSPSWKSAIWSELNKQYFLDIQNFLKSEIKSAKTIYPQQDDIFNALKLTDFNDIKVVILGQDPYHGPWQAHGLSFSVQEWVKVPPSLKNIYKEIWVDRESWDLTSWAKQWVLLLNAILTVEAWQPASHSKIWWWNFTDEIIRQISAKQEWVIFLLWWAFAGAKKELIDINKHLILTAPHPSPLSAYKWFFWCWHFTQVNEYLKEKWESEIMW